jgi:putative SOS response-associated peptidase YedK
MCGRFTVKMIWAEIVVLYRLTLYKPPHNATTYNVYLTDAIDIVTERGAPLKRAPTKKPLDIASQFDVCPFREDRALYGYNR